MKLGVDCVGITVVFFCHDGNGNYLLSKRSKNCRDEQGTWDFGGGALEFGLTIEENLRKELMEEYCTIPLKIEFLNYSDVLREQNNVKTHWLGMYFKVLIDPQTVKIGEPHKVDELKWFKLNEFPKDLHSEVPKAIEKNKYKLYG